MVHNDKYIAVVDLETSSADPSTCQILEIGCCIINSKAYSIVNEFHTLVKPDNPEEVTKEALEVNKLSMDELLQSPSSQVAFNTFGKFLQSYNIRKNKNDNFGAVILAGYNIRGFDMPILTRYAKKHGFVNTKGKPTIFNPIFIIDVMDHLFLYTRNHPDFKSLKLSSFLSYAGVSDDIIKKEAHSALWDTQMTAKLVIKFCKLADFMISKNADGKRRLDFRNCLKNG